MSDTIKYAADYLAQQRYTIYNKIDQILADSPHWREVGSAIMKRLINERRDQLYSDEILAMKFLLELIQEITVANIKAYVYEGEEYTNRADPLNVIHRLTTIAVPRNTRPTVLSGTATDGIGDERLLNANKENWKPTLGLVNAVYTTDAGDPYIKDWHLNSIAISKNKDPEGTYTVRDYSNPDSKLADPDDMI